MLRLLPLFLLCACVDRALDPLPGSSAAPVTSPGDAGEPGTSIPRCKPGPWRTAILPASVNQSDGAVAVTHDRVHVVYAKHSVSTDFVEHLSAPLGSTSWTVAHSISDYGAPHDFGLVMDGDAIVLRYAVTSDVTKQTGFVVVGREIGGSLTFAGGPDMKLPGGDRTLVLDADRVAHGTYTTLDGALGHFSVDRNLAVADDRVQDGDGFAAVSAIGPDGVVRIANVDPSQHLRIAHRAGAGWQNDAIGSMRWGSSGLDGIATEVAFAIDSKGVWHLGYVDSSSPFSYLRYDNGKWSDATPPTAPDGSVAAWKTFAAGPDGDVYAAFQSGHNYVPTVARLGDAKIDVIDKDAGAERFAIARDAAGATHVVYYDYGDTQLHYAYRCP